MNPNLTCGKCLLFNKQDSTCEVTVMHQGEYLQIGVRPEDKCHWQALGIEVQELKLAKKKEEGKRG